MATRMVFTPRDAIEPPSRPLEGESHVKVFSKITHVSNSQSVILPLPCPGCRREGNFQPLGQDLMFQIPVGPAASPVRVLVAGQRVCPNPDCATHVFVVYESARPGRLECSYPAGRIDFDTNGVPGKVSKAFDEALTCYANDCYVGAAMLIRKTLEAVCEDRNAAGADLKARILDLRNKVTLPQDLFDAMDHLRLLGNDAAHIKATTYDSVGKDEVAAGIELAKEIIKGTYQYKGLLDRLKALKRP